MRLGRDKGCVNNPQEEKNTVTGTGALDERPYCVLEENAIDAIVKLAADIGLLNDEKLKNNNLIFTNTAKASEDMETAMKAQVISLTDAI